MKIGIETLEGRLRLRFPRALFAGSQKYLSLNLVDSVENRLVAEGFKEIMEIFFDDFLPQWNYTAKPQQHLEL